MYTEEKQPRIKAYRERKNIMKREVIENLLKGLGVAEDKVKEAVDTIMTENGNDIERYKTSETNLKSLLKTANETLEKFKDVDIDGLKGEVQKYKDAAAEAELNSKAEIERLQFGYALDGALGTAGAPQEREPASSKDNSSYSERGEEKPRNSVVAESISGSAANDKSEDTLEKEKQVQEAMLKIKKRFGKNAILKGTNLQEGATAKERNAQIGGHKA